MIAEPPLLLSPVTRRCQPRAQRSRDSAAWGAGEQHLLVPVLEVTLSPLLAGGTAGSLWPISHHPVTASAALAQPVPEDPGAWRRLSTCCAAEVTWPGLACRP